VDEVFARAGRIAELVRAHPDADAYLTPVRRARPRRLSPAQLEARSDGPDVVAAYEVPERSVRTAVVADWFGEAVRGESLVAPCWDTRVLAVAPDPRRSGRWTIEVTTGGAPVADGPYDAVVNALWEGRSAIDAPLGVHHTASWTHRYRASLFVHVRAPVGLPSAFVTVGPFGDVKNYDGRHLYLSWYEAGLVAEGNDLGPPPIPPLDDERRRRIVDGTFAGLGTVIPGLEQVRDAADSIEVGGGWVYAAGRGALLDPRSGLHRRDEIGVVHRDGYVSIDTGKLSVAPWIARQVAELVRDGA
jgi:hypothetical protein